MRYGFGMLIFVSIYVSVMLPLFSHYNGEKVQGIIEKDTTKQDYTKQNKQFNFGGTEEAIDEEKDNIPWGFSKISYQIYKSGALDLFIPNGSTVEQCVSADLNMDGIGDVLLSCSMPADSNDAEVNHTYSLNTLILKGTGGGAYQLEVENQNANIYSSYDGSAILSAGEGWFKLTRSRGTAGGYVYSYFFEYDQERNDWFFNTYYYNRYGYTEEGRSVVQTPDNFGSISFKDFNSSTDGYTRGTEGVAFEEELTIDEMNFKIHVSPCYVNLKDKRREYRINKMITEHIATMVDKFRELDTNVDILIQGDLTYETSQIICIEYELLGTIDGDEMNYSGINRKYITVMFDIEKVRQITLSEIVDIEKLYSIMKQEGVVYGDSDSNATWKTFNNMKKKRCIELLKRSDCLQAALGVENTGIFSTIYEKSLCLYFQPEFIGMGPYCEEPMIFVPLENLLSDIKLNYWELPEDKISRIQWMG